jgi:hypothetical protein
MKHNENNIVCFGGAHDPWVGARGVSLEPERIYTYSFDPRHHFFIARYH